uniref:Dimethylargininase n=1 Tax=Macrostomum lignano TaxID=282301 RepID=A0A1I8I5P7_9PLAT
MQDHRYSMLRTPMFKLVLIGESGVGKTSLFMRIKEDIFSADVTVGIDSCSTSVEVDEARVKVIVANKNDLNPAITQEQLQNFAATFNCKLISSVSAKTGDGVSDMLREVARKLLKYYSLVGRSGATGVSLANSSMQMRNGSSAVDLRRRRRHGSDSDSGCGSQRRCCSISAIRQTLKRQLGMKVAEISIDGAQLEGSDVLFTGKEIIVGISTHTNEAGATCYPVTIVSVPQLDTKKGTTSLKDLVCMAGTNVIAVGLNPAAQKTIKEINWKATYSYRVIQLPEDQASNCLYINGFLVHLSPELIPNSIGIFENKIDYNRIPISLPHLTEQRVPMTKLCLLVQKTKNSNLKNIMSTLA